MNTNRKPHTPAARSTSPLFAIAKAITNFLFGESPLPTSFSHHAAFFAGLETGEKGASAISTYLNRNKCDRAKIQLAVYHIIHLFQHHLNYEALLQHPQKLLKCMEPEVFCMVDKHLTKNEADEVTRELKRKYEAPVVEGHVRKRAREHERNVVREHMGRDIVAAHLQAQRGFLSESDDERTEEDDFTPNQPETKAGPRLDARSGIPVQGEDLDNCYLSALAQKQLQVKHGQYDEDMIDPDGSTHLPLPSAIMTPCLHTCRSSAPSPESSPAFVGLASTPTPAPKDDGYGSDDELEETGGSGDQQTRMPAGAKSKEPVKSSQQFHRQGYGFTYDDPDLYTSSSSEEENTSSLTPMSPSDEYTPLDKYTPPDEYTPPDWINKLYLKAKSPLSDDHRTDTTALHKLRPSPSRPPTVIAMVHGMKGLRTSSSPIPEGGPASSHLVDQQALPPARNDLMPQSQEQANTAQAGEMQERTANELPFAHWSAIPETTYSDSDGSEMDTESPTSPVQATSPSSSRAAGSATPPPANASSRPAIHSTPIKEAQQAANGTATEPASELLTTPPHHSAAHPALRPLSRNTLPPKKKNQRCPPNTTAHQPQHYRTQHSPPQKRKSTSPSPSPSQEQAQPSTSSPPPAKHAHFPPPHDNDSTPPAPQPHEPPPPSPDQQAAKQRRSRGRGHRRHRSMLSSSPASTPTTPEPAPLSKKATDAQTGTRRSARSRGFGGVYTK